MAGNVEPDPEAQRPVVLVVEDDVLQCMWVSRCLEQADFTVIEAVSVEEAQLALKSDSQVDIVFADIILAGETVIDLIAWMESATPDLPVVLTSGQSRPFEALNLATCSNVADYLPKPFVCDQVKRVLRERIEATRGASGSGS